MTDRTVKVLEQGKTIVRGLKTRGRGAVLALDDDETLNVTFDWSTWLGSDTISSVTNETTAVTISGASNTTTTATFKVSASGSGWVQHRITTAAGLVKEFLLMVEVGGCPVSDDYGLSFRV